MKGSGAEVIGGGVCSEGEWLAVKGKGYGMFQ